MSDLYNRIEDPFIHSIPSSFIELTVLLIQSLRQFPHRFVALDSSQQPKPFVAFQLRPVILKNAEGTYLLLFLTILRAF